MSDILSVLDGYLQTKASGWALIQTACLIELVHLLKKDKKRKQESEASKLFIKIIFLSKIGHKNH